MKKIIVFIIIILMGLNAQPLSAAAKCSTTSKQKVCITTKAKTITTETWDYRNEGRKNLVKRVRLTKSRANGKLVSQRIREYHPNGKLKYNRVQEVGVSDIRTTYFDNGKRKKLQTIKYSATTKSTDIINSNKEGKFTGGTYQEVKRSDGSLVKEETHTAFPNGKVKEIVENRFDGKKKVYNRVRRNNENGQAYYDVIKKYGDVNSVETKTFENGKAIKSEIVEKKNNVVVKETLILFHKPGGYKKSAEVRELSNGNLAKHYIDTFSDESNAYRNSQMVYVYSGSQVVARNYEYFNRNQTRVGVRNIVIENGVYTSDVRKNFVSGSQSKVATKITTTYHPKNITKEILTENFNADGTLSSKNVESFNESKKRTQNMNFFYNSKQQLRLQKGYTYTDTRYSYIHNEYKNGVIVMEDKTVFKADTITKVLYERAFFRNGNLVFRNTYNFDGGNITTIDSNTGVAIASTTTKLASMFPITYGTITSPAWFYPQSFGGNWHPAIDVAPFSLKDVGFAQNLKWTFANNGVVLSRHNGCSTTNSYGCGPGSFGNHVLIAVEHEGDFYTVLFGHMSKLKTTGTSSDANAPHKIFERIKPGVTIKQNDIIGIVGSSGNSSGYHTHIQIQQHTYASSLEDIKARFKEENSNILFNVAYSDLSNYKDILTVNPDVIFNLRYAQTWSKK